MVASGVALIHMPRIVERTATYLDNEMKTIEELLIELDAEDTQLSNEAAKAIRNLKRDLEMACMNFYELKEELDALK